MMPFDRVLRVVGINDFNTDALESTWILLSISDTRSLDSPTL